MDAAVRHGPVRMPPTCCQHSRSSSPTARHVLLTLVALAACSAHMTWAAQPQHGGTAYDEGRGGGGGAMIGADAGQRPGRRTMRPEPLPLSATLSFLATFYQDVLPALRASSRHPFSEVWHPAAVQVLDAVTRALAHSGVLGDSSSSTTAGREVSGTQQQHAADKSEAHDHLTPLVPSALASAEAHASQVARMVAGTAGSTLVTGGGSTLATGGGMGGGAVAAAAAGPISGNGGGAGLAGSVGGDLRAAPLSPSVIREAGAHVPNMLAGLWALWSDVCGGAGRVGALPQPNSQLLPAAAACEGVEGAAARTRCTSAVAAEALKQASQARVGAKSGPGRGCEADPRLFTRGGICNGTLVPDITRSAFPAVRRVALAALHALHLSAAAGRGAGEGGVPESEVAAVAAWGKEAVDVLSRIDTCARAVKPVADVLHVSKAGGTSMCELGRLAGRKSRHFNSIMNCKMQEFGFQPRWCSEVPEFVPELCRSGWWLVPPMKCGVDWDKFEWGNCALRAQFMAARGWDWQLNEASLHAAKPNDITSAQVCMETLNAVVVRDPLARLASHIAHMRQEAETSLYAWCNKTLAQAAAAGKPGSTHTWLPWRMPSDVVAWARLAPAPLDNYLLRHLLGRPAHCRGLDLAAGSAFNRSEAAAGAARLLAFDSILLVDDGPRAWSNVVLRSGWGWNHTLRDVAFRAITKPHSDLERDLGLSAPGYIGGASALLSALNAWDAALVGGIARPALALDAAWVATATAAAGQLKLLRRELVGGGGGGEGGVGGGGPRAEGKAGAGVRSDMKARGLAAGGGLGGGARAAGGDQGRRCGGGLCSDPSRLMGNEKEFMEYRKRTAENGDLSKQGDALAVPVDPRLLLFGGGQGVPRGMRAFLPFSPPRPPPPPPPPKAAAVR